MSQRFTSRFYQERGRRRLVYTRHQAGLLGEEFHSVLQPMKQVCLPPRADLSVCVRYRTSRFLSWRVW